MWDGKGFKDNFINTEQRHKNEFYQEFELENLSVYLQSICGGVSE